MKSSLTVGHGSRIVMTRQSIVERVSQLCLEICPLGSEEHFSSNQTLKSLMGHLSLPDIGAVPPKK